MKLNELSQRALLALAVLAGALASSDARAESTISWGAATTITGDSDVINTNPIYAVMTTSNPSTATVNGVTFTNTPPPGTYVYSNTFNGVVGPNTGTGTPFNNLSSAYQTVLNFGGTASTGNAAIGFTGLTSGQIYQFQIFVDDSSGTAGSEKLDTTTTSDVNSGASGTDLSGTVSYNSGSAGSLGQYITGTFQADATGQENVAFVSGGNVLVNAVVLNQLSAVPEPSSIVMVGIGCAVGLGTYVRRRRTRSN